MCSFERCFYRLKRQKENTRAETFEKFMFFVKKEIKRNTYFGGY